MFPEKRNQLFIDGLSSYGSSPVTVMESQSPKVANSRNKEEKTADTIYKNHVNEIFLKQQGEAQQAGARRRFSLEASVSRHEVDVTLDRAETEQTVAQFAAQSDLCIFFNEPFQYEIPNRESPDDSCHAEQSSVKDDEEHNTTSFVEAVLKALQVFYQFICDTINYMIPDYFKTKAQSPTDTSEEDDNYIENRFSV